MAEQHSYNIDIEVSKERQFYEQISENYLALVRFVLPQVEIDLRQVPDHINVIFTFTIYVCIIMVSRRLYTLLKGSLTSSYVINLLLNNL